MFVVLTVSEKGQVTMGNRISEVQEKVSNLRCPEGNGNASFISSKISSFLRSKGTRHGISVACFFARTLCPSLRILLLVLTSLLSC